MLKRFLNSQKISSVRSDTASGGTQAEQLLENAAENTAALANASIEPPSGETEGIAGSEFGEKPGDKPDSESAEDLSENPPEQELKPKRIENFKAYDEARKNDAIKELFSKGDDETIRSEALQPAQVYVQALIDELSIRNLDAEVAESLDTFTREVVMSAGWYQYKYLTAKHKAWFYIAVNIAMVLGMPLAVIGFGMAAAAAGVNSFASQIAAVLTGVFALQKTLSAWYASQQSYATWYKACFDLKCLYHTFVQTWETRAYSNPPALLDALRKATTAATEIIKNERMAFYTAMALPTFDVLTMLTAQRAAVSSWVSGLVPAQPAAKRVGASGLSGVDHTGASATTQDNSKASSDESTTDATPTATDDSAGSGDATDNASMLQVSLKLPVSAPPLTQSMVDECNNCPALANAGDIETLFNGNFIDWFNRSLGSNAAFSDRNHIRDDNTTRQRFTDFWNRIPDVYGQPSITVTQFIALMCIALQENRGNFFANPEIVNSKLHPHLAYAFDRIGQKQSYNLMSGNSSAAQLFKDKTYVDAHDKLAGYRDVVSPFVDPAWGGSVWPSHFKTDEDETINGFIMQADFYKLRGRGVIQTTGRSNYKDLLLFLFQQGIADDSPILDKLQSRRPAGATTWTPSPSDLNSVLTETRNGDWDKLFSMAAVLAAGVRVHAMKRGYLHLGTTASVLGASSALLGSYYRVGSSINGGNYPVVVSTRMISMTEEFARLRNPDIGTSRPARVLDA
ncbi:hypothetical protein [Paraburkholderia graminis]|uniref:Transmembrane protein n=1 Tax=Paraburkholderia graminis TaxID=60548 RepID=A0ABD5CLM1_9BURK|nr:hypothetical protein [Paraburkholderia graminis]MDR6205440.1 hypothetical protein [Paraburkholderia graminis]